jgi:hypothetical protein
MTNADIMILAYPVIGAAVMAAAAVGMIFFFGYHKPAPRRADARHGIAPLIDAGDLPFRDGVVMRLTEAEARNLLAERAAGVQRQPGHVTP